MKLNKAAFDAKAEMIQAEITQKLNEECKRRGTKVLPNRYVNNVFHQALSYYMEWAYKEGLEVARPLVDVNNSHGNDSNEGTDF